MRKLNECGCYDREVWSICQKYPTRKICVKEISYVYEQRCESSGSTLQCVSSVHSPSPQDGSEQLHSGCQSGSQVDPR